MGNFCPIRGELAGDDWVTPEMEAVYDAEVAEAARGPQWTDEGLIAWAAAWEQRRAQPTGNK